MWRYSTGKFFGPTMNSAEPQKFPAPENKSGYFPPIQKAHETTHGKTRDSPVFPIGERTVMCIDIVNKLRIIYWKLPKSFYRVNIVRTQIIFFIGRPVVAVRFHYNYLMGRNKIRNIISLVVSAFIKFIKLLAPVSEITLRPAMKKINHRIFFLRIVKIAGR